MVPRESNSKVKHSMIAHRYLFNTVVIDCIYSMTVINFDFENFGSIIVIVVQNVQCNKFENLHVPYCACPWLNWGIVVYYSFNSHE